MVIEMVKLNGFEENFKFLVLEVRKQLDDTLKIVENPANEKLIEKVMLRDDYIDNMKNVIENKVNTFLVNSSKLDQGAIRKTRAISVITVNLERSADHMVNIVKQTRKLNDVNIIKNYRYRLFFTKIKNAIKLITKSLDKGDIHLALKICGAEVELDKLYETALNRIVKELRSGENTEDLVSLLFIFQCLERIGDAMQNIGEALMSIVMGERIKIHQYEMLEETFGDKNGDANTPQYAIDSIAETKSGNHVRRVNNDVDGFNPNWVIYKEGKKSKIINEKKNFEVWEGISTGLPPKVYGFHKNGTKASLIIQYLPGKTIKELIINSSRNELKKHFRIFTKEVERLWNETKKPVQANSRSIDQLHNRIEEVYKVHPEFKTDDYTIGDLHVSSLEEMVNKASKIEENLSSPFSVFIHGDFNNDNMLIDSKKRSLHYIDLHRSTNTDYVQDVSVFLISNFRMPLFEEHIRDNIDWTIQEFLNFTLKYAKKNKDETIQARLALSLVRSFITSTRFELNKKFAKSMYLKAMYLLGKLNEHEGDWEEFEVPKDIFNT